MDKKLRDLFLKFYDEEYLIDFERILDKLKIKKNKKFKLNSQDIIFLTYPNSIENLNKLYEFTKENKFEELFSTIHILPFLESDADGGFAVVDYKKVDLKYGTWREIKKFSKRYKLISDLILNHTSNNNKWFLDFLDSRNNFYFKFDKNFDYSKVFRPRSTSLFTNYLGTFVWTTFSDKQVDLNLNEVKVFFNFLEIISFYFKKGINILRLDAIPYLFKKSGTSCVNLDENYDLVELFIKSLKHINSEVKFISEVNFGDEVNLNYLEKTSTDLIYEFTFPMLLIYCIYNKDFKYFLKWAQDFDFNKDVIFFLSNHDGISFRGIKNFLNENDFNDFFNSLLRNNFLINYKTIDGKDEPYELNSTYFSLLKEILNKDPSKEHLFCFNLLLFIKGVPLIYYLDIIKAQNDYHLFSITNHKRDLSRPKFKYEDYLVKINNSFFDIFKNLVLIRNQFDFDKYSFKIHEEKGFLFLSYENESEILISISNITSLSKEYKFNFKSYFDLIEDKIVQSDIIYLEKYNFKWIKIVK